MNTHDTTVSTIKHGVDALSLLFVAATLAKILPPLAAFLSIVWTAIRIYETKTVQAILFGDDD